MLITAACLTWLVVAVGEVAGAQLAHRILGRLAIAAGIVSAAVVAVAAGLLATVPLTRTIGDLTGDPGIARDVQAGIAQAGTVVLLTAMIGLGVTTVLVAHIGRQLGTVPRWIVALAWVSAVGLLLGVTVALLIPFGIWAIAFGVAWSGDESVRRRSR